MKKTITEWRSRWDAAKTNGCTRSPDLWMKEACDRHDRHYGTHRHRDGRFISRWQADVELMKDARKSAPGLTPLGRFVTRNTIPPFYFIMTRLFGWKYW